MDPPDKVPKLSIRKQANAVKGKRAKHNLMMK